jgi:ligand-binding sensor domain-containing protein/signal transduction histidine kinase
MRTWHVADGLPSDSVTAILQTRDGFLWIGTAAGLVRFDGVTFTEIKSPDSVTNTLTGVTALCEDSDGRLWIGTQQEGLFRLAQGKIFHYGKSQGFSGENVTSLAADNRGQIWIGGTSGLNFWNGQNFQLFTRRDGLPDESVSGVNVARSGAVWITTRVGMCQFINGHIAPYALQTESQGRSPEYLGAYEDRRGNLWAFGDTYLINLAEGKRFNYFRSSESASVRIWSLCEGRDGRLWIGTSGRGLFCFEDNRFQPVIFGESRWSYDVRAICEDREGNLWLGTSGGGLMQMRIQSVHAVRGGQGLPDSLPTALALDASGRIYIGLQRGGLWAGEPGRFDRLGGGGLELQNFISSVAVAADGTVWAGTLGDGLYGLRYGRGIHFTTADGLANNTVLSVCVDNEGNVWASTSAGTVHRFTGNGVTRFDARQGLPAPVTVMVSAAAGGLWLGTQDGKILREKNGKFTGVETMSNLLEHDPVLALHEGEKGRLWIGTAGGGLASFADGAGLNWGTNNGLPAGTVAGVLEDHAKNLWLGTDTGIYRVNHGDVRRALADPQVPLACKLISAVKTLPESSTIFGGVRALLAPDEYLWFATSEGVLNVDTHHAELEASSFPVYLESFAINGQPPVSLLQSGLWPAVATNNVPFKMPVDLRSLEIRFTALSFGAPDEIQFRHKLEGFDPDWVNDENIRLARYGRLPHGDYRFRVAARVGGRPWEDQRGTFAFTVPTPIYFQAWAIGLYVIAAVALVAGIVRVISHRRLRHTLVRLEQQQSLERERMRIARDMHDEMGSKLTKISFLSEHIQMAGAAQPFADKIQSIAHTARELLKTMDEIVWVVNPRNDTLENLVAYLNHYAVEYFQNTSIECEMRLQEIPHYPLSSEVRHNLFLAFEETLNNVLKHSKATKVKVETTIQALEFELKVTDNGEGFEIAGLLSNGRTPAGRVGNGLKNMRQRLASVGGECLLSSQPRAGTSVTLRIPINKKPPHMA